MFNIKDILPKTVFILTKEQKEKFDAYIPGKVYFTERNISILVAATQFCMILLFLEDSRLTFDNFRSAAYFSLYVFLFTATCIALALYQYTVKNKKYKTFIWLRRIYAFVLCMWVIGITFLEQMPGKGITVYCYLLPTTAALLLLSPIESTVIFGSTWLGLVFMLMTLGNEEGSLFGNMVNSVFVMILSLFISFRYYRSMATEFKDREVIATQYSEIQRKNSMLQQMVQIDNLTGLYNRHYFHEKLTPMFEENRQKNYDGIFLMLDVDYFKQYNDTYGHMQGDTCLKELAAVIRELCVEEGAFAIRFGGEEFLIVKMTSKTCDAEAFAEKLEVRIKEKNIERSDTALKRITVSMGLCHSRLSDITHLEQAVKYADDALYCAKSQGRNKIVCAKPEEAV